MPQSMSIEEWTAKYSPENTYTNTKPVSEPRTLSVDEFRQKYGDIGSQGTITREPSAPVQQGDAGSLASLSEYVPEGLGEVAGGVIGGFSGPIGAGVGAAVGDLGESYLEYKAKNPRTPKTIPEALLHAGKAGATAAAATYVGGKAYEGIAGAAASKFPFKSVIPESKQTLKTLADEGIEGTPSLAHVTDSPAIDKGYGILRNSFFGGDVVKGGEMSLQKNISKKLMGEPKPATDPTQFGTMVKGQLDKTYGDIVGKGGFVRKEIDPTKVGEDVKSFFDTQIKQIEASTKPIYNKVRDITKTEKVKVPVVKTTESQILGPTGKPILRQEVVGQQVQEQGGAFVRLQSLKKEFLELAEIAQRSGNVEARTYGDDIVRAVQQYEDVVPFEVAQTIRSKLLSAGRVLSNEYSKDVPAVGKAVAAARKVDKAIEVSLSKFDQRNKTEALKMWRSANEQYKSIYDIYENDVVSKLRRMITTDPQKATKEIMQPNDVTGLKYIKRALKVEDGVENPVFKNIQDDVVESILQKAQGTGEYFNSDVALKEIQRYGQGFLRELLGADRFNGLLKTFQELKTFQGKVPAQLIEKLTNKPEEAMSLFGSNNVTAVRQLKQLNNPQLMEEYKKHIIQDILRTGYNKETQMFSGLKMSEKAFGSNGYGKAVLNEALGPELTERYSRLFRAIEQTQRKQESGGGGMLIQLIQGGSLGAAVTGAALKSPGLVAQAAGVTGIPYLLSKYVMMSPKVLDMVVNGVKLKQGTPAYFNFISRLIAQTARENMPELNEYLTKQLDYEKKGFESKPQEDLTQYYNGGTGQ